MEATGDASIFRFIDKLSPEKIAGINAVIQLEITGETEDVWQIILRDGGKEIRNCRADSPTLIMTCDSEDFTKLLNGQLDVMRSFMTGKLRISGDMSFVMKLAALLG